MSKEKLEKTCILEEIGDNKFPLDSSSCTDCLENCYLPKDMSPEKKEFYRNGCKSINGYGSKYNSS